MATAPGDLQLSLTANTTGLVAGMATAQKSLQTFKESASKSREIGKYFAGALTEIGGASKGAAGLVGNLVSALAIGGPMGLAAAGVNLLVGYMRDAREAAAAAEEASKKWTESLKAKVDDLSERIAIFNAEMRGGALAVAEFKADKERTAAAAELKKATDAVAAAENDLAEARARNLLELEAGISGPLNEEEYLKKIKAAKEQARLAQLAYAFTVTDTENDLSVARTKHSDAATKAIDQVTSAIQRNTAAAQDNAATPLGPAGLELGIVGSSAVAPAFAGAESQFPIVKTDPYHAQRVELIRAEADAAADALNEAKLAAQDLAAVADDMAYSFGNAFGEIVSGSADAADAFENMAKRMLVALAQLAASQIPVVGPIVSGFVGAFAGRASGGSVTAGTPYVVGERGPELFVPGSNGTIVPNEALGGSTTVNVHINAMDAKSFEDFYERQSSVVLRKHREWQRDRR